MLAESIVVATKIVDYSMKAILAWTGLLLVGASSDIALAEPTQYLCTVEHAGDCTTTNTNGRLASTGVWFKKIRLASFDCR